jgi:hypothetical protein
VSSPHDDAEPSALQRFFLKHKEINVAEFAPHKNGMKGNYSSRKV